MPDRTANEPKAMTNEEIAQWLAKTEALGEQWSGDRVARATIARQAAELMEMRQDLDAAMAGWEEARDSGDGAIDLMIERHESLVEALGIQSMGVRGDGSFCTPETVLADAKAIVSDLSAARARIAVVERERDAMRVTFSMVGLCAQCRRGPGIATTPQGLCRGCARAALTAATATPAAPTDALAECRRHASAIIASTEALRARKCMSGFYAGLIDACGDIHVAARAIVDIADSATPLDGSGQTERTPGGCSRSTTSFTGEAEAIRPRIYTASKTEHAVVWRRWRSTGANIVSTWIDEAGEGESASMADLWSRCVHEARSATAVVLYCKPGEILKGAYVEVGCAIANGVPIYVVGEPAGSWVNHPLVTRCSSIDEAMRRASAINIHNAPASWDDGWSSGATLPTAPPDEIARRQAGAEAFLATNRGALPSTKPEGTTPFTRAEQRVAGRAYTPQEKRALIDALYTEWLLQPQLRLGQLVVVLAGGDPFYKEDASLISAGTTGAGAKP